LDKIQPGAPEQGEDLVFDGERFIPGAGVGIAYEHWSRYAFASQLVEGRDVLEVGCGEGYGSAFLAERARSVVAFDASGDAIMHARKKYGAAARFEQMTVRSFFEAGPEAAFDMIVAFELIEHIPPEDQALLIDGIRHALRPGGIALISTPDKLLYTDVRLAKNPFHVREYYRDEFVAELKARFPEVRIYEQALLTGCAVVAPGDARLAAVQMSWTDLVRAQGTCRPGLKTSGEYLVALVGAEALPQLPSVLLADFSRKLIAEGLQFERHTADRLARELEGARRAWEDATKVEAQAREDLVAARREEAQAREELAAARRESSEAREATAREQASVGELRAELADARSALRAQKYQARHGLEPSARDLARILRSVPARQWLLPPSAARTVRALWRRRGVARAVEETGLFDRKYYLARNGDVARSGIDPVEHYVAHGAAEGRDPNPFFDTAFYLTQNPDVARSAVNPLLHYHEHGWAERRDPHPLFRTRFYLAQNPDVAAAGIDPLAHYLERGAAEGRLPSPVHSRSRDPRAWTEAARRWRAEVEPHPWRALVVDLTLPKPDRDSGSITTLELMKALQSLGYAVTVAPTDLQLSAPYAEALGEAGFWCVTQREISDLPTFFRDHGSLFDVVVLCRIPVACHLVAVVEEHCPDATLVFETVDLHWIREEREAALLGSDDVRRRVAETKRLELDVALRADAVIVHSAAEKEVLGREAPEANVFEVPYVLETQGPGPGFDERRDIMFLGGFRHRPNVDAVTWFVREVFPLVRSSLPGVRFLVVGSDPPDEVLRLAADDVVVTGHVDLLGPVFDACRVTVAPLRYGAGYKGKVAMSMAHGVPGVLTAVAAEGMRLTHEHQVLIANGPAAFAAEVTRLYRDIALWKRLARAGLETVTERFSPQLARVTLEGILRAAGTDLWTDPDSRCAELPRIGREQPGRGVFPSRFMCQLHARAGVKLAATSLVPHGVAFHHAPDAPRADRSALVEPGVLRLLFAGRITHFKGLHTALDALPMVAAAAPHLDVRLTIVGDTSDASYVSQVRRTLENRGLAERVRWEATVPEERLFELFQQHDVYLFPSLFEPFALTLILALEAGIPTVATTAGGNVDLIIDHASGLLFPPADAEALAAAIAELAANPLLRQGVSRTGRAAAEKLDLDTMLARLEAILAQAAQRASVAGSAP
jgi:glycosyltransferase involved in cell wall biosynthesis/SAM-dependent methyltransferase